jgi:MYXO-CTERM domain-containing protein
MKKLMITAAALMIAVAAYGQGSFLFNTHDTSVGNDVKFVDANGNGITGSDFFVEVLVGPDATHLTALTPTLPLSRTGAGAGYTSPFSQVYNTTLPAGTAVVAYRAFEGTSFASATVKSAQITQTLGASPAPLSVALAVAPAPPNELLLGAGTVQVLGASVPEPATLALGALGVGALLMIRRRK